MKSLNEIIEENKKANVNPDVCSICKADLRYTADKHKVQGLWFCNKCFNKHKNSATKIRIANELTITKGGIDTILVITNGRKTIKFTSVVLRRMLATHNALDFDNFDVNDKILSFLQEIE